MLSGPMVNERAPELADHDRAEHADGDGAANERVANGRVVGEEFAASSQNNQCP